MNNMYRVYTDQFLSEVEPPEIDLQLLRRLENLHPERRDLELAHLDEMQRCFLKAYFARHESRRPEFLRSLEIRESP